MSKAQSGLQKYLAWFILNMNKISIAHKDSNSSMGNVPSIMKDEIKNLKPLVMKGNRLDFWHSLCL